MSIFKKIGQFFKSLFNSMKKTYNKLSDEQKDALVHGTGLVAIINDNLEESPAKVRELIQAKFPELDLAKLETALFEVAQSFNLTGFDTLDDCIGAIQAYLNRQEGKAWAIASHSIASLLSILFAPKDTKVATIVSLIEWVYRRFIKKDVD